MKSTVVTFKADPDLAESLKGVRNKSEFIRAAISAALDNTCPLCRGSGIMTGDQQMHWKKFASHHTIEKCADCKALHLVCMNHNREH